MAVRLGIDIGGTFTDFITLADGGTIEVHKLSSTPEAPEKAVLAGIEELAHAGDTSVEQFLSDVDLIVHGMTIATNTLIERSGPKTAVLHTEGFRDILDLRDGYKPERYKLRVRPPDPFVPRYLRLGVRERVLYTGEVDTPLEEERVRQALRFARAEGVKAIGVCLLWSMINPAHEHRIRQLIHEELDPDTYVALSSDVLPTMGEYPRASATVVSAYVGSSLGSYLDRLTEYLHSHGYRRDLLVMQVTGGVATADGIRRHPVLAVGSGPAAGPAAAVAVGSQSDERDLLVIDMGGTSFEVSVVTSGEATMTREITVAGLPLGVAGVDVHSVGAGGGSIAWVDGGGMLRVGPQSAGADPGPAGYSRGGAEPTVTDANLVLGYLDADYFLGGRIRLDPALAERALERVAGPLGLSVTEAAAAIYRVVNTNMVGAMRAVTVMRGIDPRGYTMVTGGGAGGIHAAAIAEELGVGKLLTPRIAGGLCAYGMVVADVHHSYVRTEPMRSGQFDSARIAELYEEMAAEALADLTAEGFSKEQISLFRSADSKYPYQTNDLTIALPEMAPNELSREISETFHTEHERLYSYSVRHMPVDVISWRLTAIGRLPRLKERANAQQDRAQAVRAHRNVFFAPVADFLDTPILEGQSLRAGDQFNGPVIAEFPTTTLVVPPNHVLTVTASDDLLVQRFRVILLRDTVDETKIRFVDVEGIRTRYYVAGEGEPLVLIHGGHFGFVCALDTWSLNLQPFGEQFRVYAFDKLGQGQTDIPARDEDYTYDAVLQHACSWLDAVGLEKAHLVGHSRGGLLAMSLALAGYAKTLVIVNSATLGPDPSNPELDSNRFYAEIEGRLPAGPPTPEGVSLEPEANSFSTEHITPAYIERYVAIARLPAQLDAAQRMRARLNDQVFMPSLISHREETLRRLSSEGVPARTLLVWSRNDPSASFAEVGLPLWHLLCERSRDVELHVVNQAGHYSFRECPEEFNRLVPAFCLTRG